MTKNTTKALAFARESVGRADDAGRLARALVDVAAELEAACDLLCRHSAAVPRKLAADTEAFPREAPEDAMSGQERAALYCGAELPLLDGAERDFWAVHLAAFAAGEMARVREAQRPHLGELAVGARVVASSKVRHNLTVAVIALDAATRPERPARAKAQKRTAKAATKTQTCPNCGRPLRFPLDHWHCVSASCQVYKCKPPKKPGLSALAKAAKKGKAKP